MHASNAVANIPSQQAVNLEVVGPRFFEDFLFWMVFLRPMTIQKNGVNWGNGFAIGDANTKTDP